MVNEIYYNSVRLNNNKTINYTQWLVDIKSTTLLKITYYDSTDDVHMLYRVHAYMYINVKHIHDYENINSCRYIMMSTVRVDFQCITNLLFFTERYQLTEFRTRINIYNQIKLCLLNRHWRYGMDDWLHSTENNGLYMERWHRLCNREF